MAKKLTHERFNERTEAALNFNKPAGQGFNPALQKLRQTASMRQPTQLPRLPRKV